MKTIFILLILLIGSSCTRMGERKKLLASWIGRSVEQLERHPDFSAFREKTKAGPGASVVKTYMDGSPVMSKARCQALGGCIGMTQHWCEHVFTIEGEIITHYEQVGPCPYNSKLLPTEEMKK
jgi:hypothetical protein